MTITRYHNLIDKMSEEIKDFPITFKRILAKEINHLADQIREHNFIHHLIRSNLFFSNTPPLSANEWLNLYDKIKEYELNHLPNKYKVTDLKLNIKLKGRK